ncbi:MAG: MtrB/PioB family decaheme-associated outer membrane protein [Betaproteobacteria bacterium]|nr:MAG: MtrB/PioB family decaheme-associated outer membrane protein [Betaproteobacteria bacterium]
MKSSKKELILSRTLAALAVAAMWSTVQAQEAPDIGPVAMPGPGTSVSVGVGVASGDERDRARFGMFNGLRRHDVNGLIGFRYEQPYNASGLGLKLEGRNLGLDNRELNFVYRRPGDVKVTADYSEITRHDPRTINTSLAGAGTTNPTVNPGGVLIAPGTGQNLNLELKRKGIGVGVEKWLTRDLQLEFAFKNEEKDGSRLFGRGFACSRYWADAGVCSSATANAWGVLMLPEPVDSVIRQIDARLNYASGPLVLSGGYYGSFYVNHNGSIRPTVNGPLGNQFTDTGTITNDAGLLSALALPVALQPDNQAHQLFVAGNYALTHSTRVNFKYAYTTARQDESFSGMGLTGAPGGRDNLGGRVDTTKAQVGFSTRPLQKLHVSGDVAYEKKDNKTPLDLYNAEPVCVPPAVFSSTTRSCSPASGTATRFYTNGNMSPKKYEAKLQGTYFLTPMYAAVLGANYEQEDFGQWTPTDVAGGVSGLKQKLNETGWRAELRRTASETFTGSVAYHQSRRKGDSPWLQPVNFVSTGGQTGVTEVSADQIYSRTAIFPFIYMDRERDKIRAIGNWTPMEKLSLQVFADRGIDRYHAPTDHGLRSFQMGTVSLDASYALSDAWKLSAFASRGRQTVDAGHSTGYDAILKDTATSFGFGVKGRPMGQLQVGADLTWLDDLLKYEQTADPTSSANATLLASTGGLPDVTYRLTRLNLYGEYALQKNAYVRLDYIHHRTYFNEWTYNFNGTPYLYSDNTTLDAKQRQTVNFIGATYVYKFQ